MSLAMQPFVLHDIHHSKTNEQFIKSFLIITNPFYNPDAIGF
jgi:hypothetical protein